MWCWAPCSEVDTWKIQNHFLPLRSPLKSCLALDSFRLFSPQRHRQCRATFLASPCLWSPEPNRQIMRPLWWDTIQSYVLIWIVPEGLWSSRAHCSSCTSRAGSSASWWSWPCTRTSDSGRACTQNDRLPVENIPSPPFPPPAHLSIYFGIINVGI